MKIINTIKNNIIKISAIFIMIPIMFYLHIYELKPIYKPKHN
ncbi:hypothetical protein PXD04_10970 [Methanosphaera sp. ISO3-F5]|nr:hypothetical protein [Methanosphaera sp. ISO3-F5]WQH64213.1 hypothetical protein PXD04_10970 [Methanosphaera sp. ISO3-F5]